MERKASDFFESLNGKTVALCGIGGSNLPLIKMFAKYGAKVLACDKRERTALGENADKAEEYGAELHLGENYLKNLGADIIFRTPGMKYYMDELVEARNNGVAVTSEMEVFFDICPCKIIAVTGSDSKTTTTTISSELLKASGKTVHLGGNIGHPLLPDIESISPEDYAVVELSSFYLDVIKDRLYCEEKNGLKRRSAQTALYLILDTMTKMFAPILAFTCDEIWLAMPHRDGDDVRNVVLNEMNKPFTEYALDDDEMAKWDALISVRNDVNGVLEAARGAKRIGKPLEASVTLHAKGASKQTVERISDMNLSELFIVSECLISDEDEHDPEAVVGDGSYNSGLTVSVKEAPGTKCPRCWMHSTKADPETGLCPRCAAVVAKL